MKPEYVKDGNSHTFGPRDPYLHLISLLEEFSSMRKWDKSGAEECRKLAWFLGDHGETAACTKIMKHATTYMGRY